MLRFTALIRSGPGSARRFFLSAQRQQHIEQRAGCLHQLASGLVSLLVTQQIGRFLVQIDARLGLLRRHRLLQQAGGCKTGRLQFMRLVADAADQLRIGALKGSRAVVKRVRSLQLA